MKENNKQTGLTFGNMDIDQSQSFSKKKAGSLTRSEVIESIKKILKKKELKIFNEFNIGDLEIPISFANENTLFIVTIFNESLENIKIYEREDDIPSSVFMFDLELIDSPLTQGLKIRNRIYSAFSDAFNGKDNIPFEMRNLIIFTDTKNEELLKLKTKYEIQGIEFCTINNNKLLHIKTIFEDIELERPSGSFIELITTVFNNFDANFKVIENEEE